MSDGYFHLAGLRIYGAPLSMHWSVLLFSGLCLIWAWDAGLYGLMAMLCYLMIILVHELGHAFVAHRLGLRVFAVQLGFFHGRCVFEKPANYLDEVLVAWGGVLAQFCLALLVFMPLPWLPDDLGFYGPVVIFLGAFNVAIALGNLWPSRSLDGGRAWKIFPLLLQRYR